MYSGPTILKIIFLARVGEKNDWTDQLEIVARPSQIYLSGNSRTNMIFDNNFDFLSPSEVCLNVGKETI